jgi:hypothetical protein
LPDGLILKTRCQKIRDYRLWIEDQEPRDLGSESVVSEIADKRSRDLRPEAQIIQRFMPKIYKKRKSETVNYLMETKILETSHSEI